MVEYIYESKIAKKASLKAKSVKSNTNDYLNPFLFDKSF